MTEMSLTSYPRCVSAFDKSNGGRVGPYSLSNGSQIIVKGFANENHAGMLMVFLNEVCRACLFYVLPKCRLMMRVRDKNRVQLYVRRLRVDVLRAEE